MKNDVDLIFEPNYRSILSKVIFSGFLVGFQNGNFRPKLIQSYHFFGKIGKWVKVRKLGENLRKGNFNKFLSLN